MHLSLHFVERIEIVLSARMRSVGLVLIASAFLIGFGIVANRYLNLAATVSVYLFVTLVVADRAGFVAASITSVVATLCLEYYFAPPAFSFRVDRPEDITALVTFEGMSLVVSRLSHRARLHYLMLERQSAEQKSLYELSRDVLLLDWKQSPERQLCQRIKQGFQVEGVALWNAYENVLADYGTTPGADVAVKAIYFHERNYDDTSHRIAHRVLYFGTRAVGSLVLYGHSLDALSINSIASIAAMAIERTRSLALEMTMEAERHSEQLRSTLLDGLAHAFKTPLATITLSSSALLATHELAGQQKNLVGLINQEATRLGDLTTRLLQMSQIKSSRLTVQAKETDTEALLQRVLDECALPLKRKRLELSIAPKTARIQCDPQVFGLALVQIVDNAAKYSPEDSVIDMSVSGVESQTLVRVHNRGSYIAPAERQKVFTRFYRSPSVEHQAPGTGLGLSIAMQAVEAHGGKISIESDTQDGTTFVIAIPNVAEESPCLL
jgi:two-component system, OmpR family, sensor histidine kinase KdpD